MWYISYWWLFILGILYVITLLLFPMIIIFLTVKFPKLSNYSFKKSLKFINISLIIFITFCGLTVTNNYIFTRNQESIQRKKYANEIDELLKNNKFYFYFAVFESVDEYLMDPNYLFNSQNCLYLIKRNSKQNAIIYITKSQVPKQHRDSIIIGKDKILILRPIIKFEMTEDMFKHFINRTNMQQRAIEILNGDIE